MRLENSIPEGWVETTLGKLPSDWKIVNAENYCQKVADGTHDSPKKTKSGKLLVTSKNIKNSKLDLNSAYHISNKDFEDVNKRSLVSKWDVLLSMIGTVGEVCLIDQEPDFAIKNVGLFKVGNETKSRWLFYFLKSKIGQNYIFVRLSGTTQQYITLRELRELPVPVPPLQEQKAIAKVLTAFDDKIELLQAQNKTLETMAQTIFKEWFGKYQIGDELPEGWRVGKLRGLAEKISKGTTPRKKDVQGKENLIFFLKVKDISDNGLISNNNLTLIPQEVHRNQLKRSILKSNDILFSIAGTIGRVAILNEDLSDCNCNQAIAFIRLKKKNEFLEYVHLWIKSKEIQTEINSSIVQGVQANVSLTVLGDLEIILPSNSKMISWKEIVKPIYGKLNINNSQIQSLTKTRDTLLPKLMSGQVRINNIKQLASA